MFQTKFSISSSLRSAFILLIALGFSACGFKPLYQNKERSASHVCDNFKVENVKGFDISGQKLKYRLQDSLNEACINTDKKYSIEVEATKSKGAIAIQKDREITRYNLYIVGNFVVKDVAGKEVYKGTSTMMGSFDAVTSDYGTYALEADTEKKLMEEMANEIALKVSSSLARKK